MPSSINGTLGCRQASQPRNDCMTTASSHLCFSKRVSSLAADSLCVFAPQAPNPVPCASILPDPAHFSVPTIAPPANLRAPPSQICGPKCSCRVMRQSPFLPLTPVDHHFWATQPGRARGQAALYTRTRPRNRFLGPPPPAQGGRAGRLTSAHTRPLSGPSVQLHYIPTISQRILLK